MTRTLCLLIAAAVLAGAWTLAPAAEPASPYKPDWDSLTKVNEAPEWFRDAKFGIYFHWGVYCVPAYGSEWYPRNMYNKGGRRNSVYQHHVKTYGDPAKYPYTKFVPQFKAEKFDPDAWADLFAKAGAQYAGPVGEHHDGFSMWASKVTPWNAKDMGPKRDIAGELAKAIRKRNMRFVMSFHHARNNLWQITRGGKKTWTGHYQYVKQYFPQLLEDPKNAIMYGYMPRAKFLDFWLAKLKEVVDQYQPDLIWFDSWLNEIPEAYQKRFLAYYYNRAAEAGKQVVVTRKQHDLPLECSVEDFEKGRADRLTKRVWLTDDTISKGSWCYTQDLRIKDLQEVLTVLIDIVSKNGCLLLNISPKADGTIPKIQQDVLLGIGAWLGTYGESIYGTRPWVTYGEGPTKMKRGGHFVGTVVYKGDDIRFTTKGNTLYAIFLGTPKGKATIKSLAIGSGLFGGKAAKVTLLGHDGAIPFTQDDQGLHLTLPAKLPDAIANAVKIEGLTIEGFQPDTSIPFAGGRARLGASDAELEGPTIAVENKDGNRQNIGFWDSPHATAAWDVTFPRAGTYEVAGRFAAIKNGTFTVQIGQAKLQATAPVTGAWDKFQNATLGTIKIDKAGRLPVKVVPVADKWAAINLSWLELRLKK